MIVGPDLNLRRELAGLHVALVKFSCMSVVAVDIFHRCLATLADNDGLPAVWADGGPTILPVKHHLDGF